MVWGVCACARLPVITMFYCMLACDSPMGVSKPRTGAVDASAVDANTRARVLKFHKSARECAPLHLLSGFCIL